MKIEQISDNQIKCTLSRSDLASRQIKISELAYGSEKTKGLFQDMMDQAYAQFGFETSNLPLMIEAIPVSMDCIILMITRIDEPDEVDESFSEFSKYDDSFDFELNSFPFANRMAPANSEPLSHVALNTDVIKVFSFDSLGSVMALARAAGEAKVGISSLYKDPSTGSYCLVIESKEADIDAFGALCNSAAEYGSKESSTFARSAFVNEHFELIIKDRALEVLRSL